jgi:hypothetical protein
LLYIGDQSGTTLADAYAPVGVRDVFIPFLSQYRPVWLGLGALALDLLIALTVTSLLRKHIGYRVWRTLHWAAYATWPLALAHGFGSGSDARLGWMATLSFACLALVAVAVAVRLVRSRSPVLQLAAGAATVGVAILLTVWYRSGPARHGWAARAGTPASLLKTSASSSTRQLVVATVPATVIGPFSGRLVGRMSTSGPDSAGDAAVAIAAAVRGSEPGIVRLTLWGSALDEGGIAMRESQVTFKDAATGTVFTGSIVGLDGNRVVADVAPSSGSRLQLVLALRIDATAGTVTGTIHATRIGSSE